MNNKNVRTIASVMIVLLALLLIVIFINYNNREYNRPHIMHGSGDIKIQRTSGEANDLAKNEDESGEDIILELSGDYDIELIESGEDSGELFSGEIVDEVSKPEKKPAKNKPPKQSSNESSIIVSRTETSNQEKQEVLNEIDDALKGLLEAVGNVKTVDETKLDASLGSEVEP